MIELAACIQMAQMNKGGAPNPVCHEEFFFFVVPSLRRHREEYVYAARFALASCEQGKRGRA